MTFLERVSQLVAGGAAAASREAGESLTQCYNSCIQRGHQLRLHAGLAPQEYSATGLRELAVQEEAQASRLKEAATAAGASIRSVESADGVGRSSHWARLVQDLDAHRLSTTQFRELSMRFAESLPQTAALFANLRQEEQQHSERLRALIARADPQALD